MDISPIVNVVATVVGVGAVLGAGLAAAAQIFHVEVDPKISEVNEALPGINCGACGYAGCGQYAEKVVEDSQVPANLCIPGGDKTAKKIADITGKSAVPAQKKVSILRCTLDEKTGAPNKYSYHGVEDCAAVEMLHKGEYTCPFACAGLGNCARACPVDAITMIDGRPHIDAEKCTGCGVCVKICPRDVLSLAVHPGRVVVHCRNTRSPREKRKICPSACIGCSLCMRNCPYEAIKMENFLPVIDHNKCPEDCPRPCIDKCPTAAILARGIGAREANKPLLEKHLKKIESYLEQ
ncbi:MAG: RnfABCDGE type electron transport complex subunit B [Vulcanimicrobiota bacterium]